eukprot:m.1055519 g.1055519  ORF g.1055519 m.1055519 type:complete len:640 (-) comp24192_c1_seq40:3498-5417(-)
MTTCAIRWKLFLQYVSGALWLVMGPLYVPSALASSDLDPYFPQFHPRLHAAHCGDPSGPFVFNGVYHLFTQQTFPWLPYTGGRVGWGHLASMDLVHWYEIGEYTGFPSSGIVPGSRDNRSCSYFTGSVSVVDGVPRAVFPAAVTDSRTSGSTAQSMEYQMSVPVNTSDPWLAEWTLPMRIISPAAGPQPHAARLAGPTAAWKEDDAAHTHRWVFVGETMVNNTAILTTWATKNQSQWAAGWDYLGDFSAQAGAAWAPGSSGDACSPSLAQGLNGTAVLYGCNAQYWLGAVSGQKCPESTTCPRFVPNGRAQAVDVGGQTSGGKGFGTADGRHVAFARVQGPADPAHNQGRWDSMLTVARTWNVDADLGIAVVYPVAELRTLRTTLLVNKTIPDVRVPGAMDLPTVHGAVLDIEVNFTWEGNVAAGVTGGLHVLTGTNESTVVQLATQTLTHAELVVNLTNATARATPPPPLADTAVASVAPCPDQATCASRCQANPRCVAWQFAPVEANRTLATCTLHRTHTGSLRGCAQCASGCVRDCAHGVLSAPVPLELRATTLSLRVLVDGSVLEAYAEGGRAQIVTRVYPTYNTTPPEHRTASLFYRAPVGCYAAPVVSVAVWALERGNMPGRPPNTPARDSGP